VATSHFVSAYYVSRPTVGEHETMLQSVRLSVCLVYWQDFAWLSFQTAFSSCRSWVVATWIRFVTFSMPFLCDTLFSLRPGFAPPVAPNPVDVTVVINLLPCLSSPGSKHTLLLKSCPYQDSSGLYSADSVQYTAVSVICFQFLARDVIYTSRAYAMMPVRLSVCLWRKCIGALKLI